MNPVDGDSCKNGAILHADSLMASPSQPEQGNSSMESLQKSSNSSSNFTSDGDSMAPENLPMNCISLLGACPVSPVLASMLDRTASTGTSLMTAQHLQHSKDLCGMESPGGPLSPSAICRGESEDSLAGADGCTTLKRRFESDDDQDSWVEELLARSKLAKQEQQQHEKALDSPQDGFPFHQDTVGLTFSEPHAAVTVAMPPLNPLLQPNGAIPPVMEEISRRAILSRHVSQQAPSLEEIASSRPKRRNVRISKDPQSIAARQRRERIADRVRVLQRLVPGGTKMDTASMLDEAIHYVKYLRLQLRALEQIENNSNCQSLGFLQQQQPTQLQTLLQIGNNNCDFQGLLHPQQPPQLQTLEQIGNNNCDSQGFLLQQHPPQLQTLEQAGSNNNFDSGGFFQQLQPPQLQTLEQIVNNNNFDSEGFLQQQQPPGLQTLEQIVNNYKSDSEGFLQQQQQPHLQTLEQIGSDNNSDSLGFLQQQQPPEFLRSARPYVSDLSSTAPFQQQPWPAPPTNMVNHHHPQPSPQAGLSQAGLSASWPVEANEAFLDAMQEQFCY